MPEVPANIEKRIQCLEEEALIEREAAEFYSESIGNSAKAAANAKLSILADLDADENSTIKKTTGLIYIIKLEEDILETFNDYTTIYLHVGTREELDSVFKEKRSILSEKELKAVVVETIKGTRLKIRRDFLEILKKRKIRNKKRDI